MGHGTRQPGSGLQMLDHGFLSMLLERVAASAKSPFAMIPLDVAHVANDSGAFTYDPTSWVTKIGVDHANAPSVWRTRIQ